MTDYTNTFGGAAKDSSKDIILGAAHDTEYAAISTASATKSNKVLSATVDKILVMTSAGDLKNSTQTIAELLASTPLTGAPTLGGSNKIDAFPSGTDMLFYQTAAPTGWTKNVTASLNDHALRIMTSGSWTSGTQGTTAFSTQFAQSFAGENYTLLTADIPAHTHSIASRSNANGGDNYVEDADSSGSVKTMNTGTTGGDGAHKHDVNLGVKYLDMIIASKD